MRTLIILLFLSVSYTIYSQSYFLPEEYNESQYIDTLVTWALKNNQQSKIYKSRIELAKENNSQAQLSWLNNINLSYQYVPVYSSTQDNSSLPRFGLGISVNIGNILNTPSRISQSEEEVKIAEADFILNQQYLRAETIRRYANYKRSVELFKVRDQAVNDSESTMLLLKHRFENGEVTLEDYNKSLRAYTDNLERRTESVVDILYHRSTLEEIVGIKITEMN